MDCRPVESEIEIEAADLGIYQGKEELVLPAPRLESLDERVVTETMKLKRKNLFVIADNAPGIPGRTHHPSASPDVPTGYLTWEAIEVNVSRNK